MDARVRRNLIDAGCSEAFVARFEDAHSDTDRLRQLRTRRRELLDSIHQDAHQLECLDYLIHEIRSAR